MSNYQLGIIDKIKQIPSRFSRKNKEQLLSFVESTLAEIGIKSQRQISKKILTHVNLETCPENPEYIIMAHYDTPTILPIWFELLFKLVGHTRQLLLLIVLLGLLELADYFLTNTVLLILQFIFLFSCLSLFIPNKKNYNDNTSGVLGLLFIAKKISLDEKLKNKVKLVFIDNEENMLSGSRALKKHWNKNNLLHQDLKIISIDCIGRGKIPVIVRNSPSELADDLKTEFSKKVSNTKLINMGFSPLSDNFNFREFGAVNISFMDKTIIPGGLYIKHIHSPLDNKVNLKNINLVVDVLFNTITDLNYNSVLTGI